ncbi:MAG: NfeD family protein [Chloroflexota bacterium]
MALLLLLTAMFWSLAAMPAGAQSQSVVHVGRLQGIINPITAGYVQRAIGEAEKAGASALVIEMDTPGGLMTSMREITGAILNSHVPVIIYVSPPGSRAASAGVFITMAAHVAAMAPNTNIGSAHPVDLGSSEPTDPTMTEKVVNDAVAQVRDMAERRGRNADWVEQAVRESVNVNSREALDLKVVDLLADDVPSLLNAIDGRQVTLSDGRTVTMSTNGAVVVRNEMNPIESFLLAISDPTIAYILLAIGVNALLFELASPGAILPGVAGLVLILMGLFSLGTLPVSLTGALLVLVAFALLAAEIFMPGFGAFGIGGIIALILGSLILMQSTPPFMAVSPYAVIGVVLATVTFFFIAIRGVLRSRRLQVTTGIEGLVGSIGQARTSLQPNGYVFIEGERWEATSAGPDIAAGDRVKVLQLEGFRLIVAPVSDELVAAQPVKSRSGR